MLLLFLLLWLMLVAIRFDADSLLLTTATRDETRSLSVHNSFKRSGAISSLKWRFNIDHACDGVVLVNPDIGHSLLYVYWQVLCVLYDDEHLQYCILCWYHKSMRIANAKCARRRPFQSCRLLSLILNFITCLFLFYSMLLVETLFCSSQFLSHFQPQVTRSNSKFESRLEHRNTDEFSRFPRLCRNTNAHAFSSLCFF